ncbi:hydrogenase-4 component G [Campylobacter lanienae]|uniref:hydrogenase-4 component G n=1 Tax=Campylobacter lanienae TaxID=75658 RepID=UPI002A90F8F3|nr:hydrogenase-4 component G [Campylobacter lanienae]MDY6135568.1 hydrogenase-4 component G [Campylobacter lanienae]
MQVNSTNSLDFLNINPNSKSNIDKIKESASNINAKELTSGYYMQFMQQSFDYSNGNFNMQISLTSLSLNNQNNTTNSFTQGLKDLLNQNIDITGYNGKPIGDLTSQEASNLISDNGYFGIDNTANRIADFVINGAGGDAGKLRSGLEGVKNGFARAEAMWGQALPDISQQTMNKTLDRINQAIMELSGNAINVTA